MRAPQIRHRRGRNAAFAALLAMLCAAPIGFAMAQEITAPAPATVPGAVSADSAAEVTAVDPATGLPAAVDATGSPTLPHDLSPWGMFLQADWVVKAVMIGLALASVITWTVALAKSVELAALRRRARHILRALGAAKSLEEAAAAVSAARRGAPAALVHAAAEEQRHSVGLDPSGIKERLGLTHDRLVQAAGRQAARATGLLATIGATAPFVGLFGTVWGIMNAFIGISKAQTTNLAVVAPGIAEALLATAIGLVAAIPAVVLYNHFARVIAAYRALLGDISAAIMQLLSRDLDRAARLARAESRREAAE